MFEGISSSFNNIFSSFGMKKSISEGDINKAVKDIKIALLESDVAPQTVSDFLEVLKPKLLGQNVIKSTSPVQTIIKITQDLITEILGNDFIPLSKTEGKLNIILMLGLQGAGKTTSSAKLAKYLEKNGSKTLLASLDTRRPAAQKQLEILAQQNNLNSLEIIENQNTLDICKRAITFGQQNGFNFLILDTAGRQNIDEELMNELTEVCKLSSPCEKLIVLDSLIGRQSLEIVKAFATSVSGLTGAILTRAESDSRGGVALNLKQSLSCQARFYGTGEKIDDLEEFYPERMASRMLDMGDIVSLVEKAKAAIEEKEAEKMQKRLEEGKFDLEDLLIQIRGLKKLGGISAVIKMIPGASKLSGMIDDNKKKEIERQEAIILSMTIKERRNPDLIIKSTGRKNRIVKGSGTTLLELNKMLKQFSKMKEMLSMAKNGKGDLSSMLGGANFNDIKKMFN